MHILKIAALCTVQYTIIHLDLNYLIEHMLYCRMWQFNV